MEPMLRALPIVLCLLSGCYVSHGDADGGPPRRDGGGPPPPPTRDLDLLFVVDNSNSMGEEQASLAAQLPLFLRVLTTGDFNQDGDTTDDEDFVPFTGLQVGVVTTDMGTGGFTVPTCARSAVGDDAVLRTAGNTSDATCEPSYPPFLAFAGSAEQLAHEAGCVTTVGTGGCGFEQQLEAALKALSPAAPQAWTAPDYAPPTFFGNTLGHGADTAFVRDGSVLGIVFVTDEEDCSASDPELFSPMSTEYVGDLNLRCLRYAADAVHPLERYVAGYLQLRRSPRRLAVLGIVGLPLDLAPATSAPIGYDAILDDPRMQEVVDPTMPNRLVPSCNVAGRGLAFPPRRFVELARQLEARGASVSLQSICQASYPTAPLIDALVRAAR